MAVYYSPLMEDLKQRNEELKEHVEQLKEQVEFEKNQVKHAKDEKVREVKLAREQEQAKAAAEKEDLMQKFRRQMQSELMSKVDASRKEYDIELASLRKSHKQELDSLLQKYEEEKKEMKKKLQIEQEKFKDDFLGSNKRDSDKFIKKVFELQKQVEEAEGLIDNLRQENKMMKEDLLKQKSEHNKEIGDTSKQNRVMHQKQMEELKEKDRIIAEKDKKLSELRRKCTSIEMAKEKVEVDLQIAKKQGGVGSPLSSSAIATTGISEIDEATAELVPRINKREEELLITNSELGVLVKRMRNELLQLKKDKALSDDRLKQTEEASVSLKKRREEDVKRIMELTFTAESKEKRYHTVASENKELTSERDRLKKELESERATSLRLRAADKKDGEVAKLKKLLATKAKEVESIQEKHDAVFVELGKLKESVARRKKYEEKANQLPSTKPHPPAVEKQVKDHRRLVELEQSMKDMTERLGESQRMKARINQRMEDLNESLRRRDKRIKTLSDDNYKLKSANQVLEESRTRTHQEIMEDWDRTRAELDRAHAQINKLQQENTTLLEDLGRKTPTKRVVSPSHLSPRHRSRSPSPRQPHNESLDRLRSPSPRMRTPPKEQMTPPMEQMTPPPLVILNPPSPGKNQTTIGMKIPIATHYKDIAPHPQIQTTPTHDHTQYAPPIELSPHSSSTPVSQRSPQKQTPSPISSSPRSPFQVSFSIPQVQPEPLSPSELSLDPDFGSEISIESLKDALELSEFEKEESKIWQDEQKAEFGKLKVKYNILHERYHSLFKRAKSMSKKIQLAHKEKLEIDQEVARLHSRANNEFDVKREDSLREKLQNVSQRVKKVEEELLEQIEENKVLHTTIATGNEERERMDAQLNELRDQLSQLESHLRESELQLEEKGSIIDTKEKQMVNLERMLVEKEEELNKATTALTLLQQQVHIDGSTDGVASLPQQQSPWQPLPQQQPPWQPLPQQQMGPQLANCLDSAQKTAKEVKKSLKPVLSIDEVNKIDGLTEYIQQVLEEAKGHGGVLPSIATPTEPFEDTDMSESSTVSSPQGHALQKHLISCRTENALLKEKILVLEHQINKTQRRTETGENSSKMMQADSEGDAEHTQQLGKQEVVSNVYEKLNDYRGTEDSIKDETTEHEISRDKNKSEMELLLSQLAGYKEREASLQIMINELEEKLATSKSSEVESTADKNDRLQEWVKQFDREKKSMKKKIQDLEMRNTEASQRVHHLQTLVQDLEGRLSEDGDSPFIQFERAKLIEQISQLKLELDHHQTGRSQTKQYLATPPVSLGLDVNNSFQRTQNHIGRGDLNQARLELQKLERSLTELLKVVYPQGIVSPTQGMSQFQNPNTLSPVTNSSPQSHAPLTLPHPLSVSLSPVTVSSSEGELTQLDKVGVAQASTGTNTEYTEAAATGEATDGSRAKHGGVRLFVTLLDYNPISLCSTGHPERELTLHTGDVIAVKGEMNKDGFYTGIFEGRTGLVPAKFLEEMEITDKEAQQRLLNQSLSRSFSPSHHGSEVDITSTPSTHRIVPMTFESMVVSSATNIPQVPRPSPPGQFAVQTFGECLMVTWRPPNLSKDGQSNGFLVTGYTIKCDGVIHKSVGETNRDTKQALLEELDPNESHTIHICTQTKEGVSSNDVAVQYNPDVTDMNRKSSVRASQKSHDSIDSNILKNKQVIATHDYDPSCDSPNPNPEHEMAFKKGQVITIYGDMREDGYYYGEMEGKFKLVPSPYVVYTGSTATKSLPYVPMIPNPSHVPTPPSKDKKNKHRRKLFTANHDYDEI